MKKLFVFAAALLALASCSQGDEPQAIVETREISFAPAATETRAADVDETLTADLDSGFAVWGYVAATTNGSYQPIFSNTTVTKQDNVWKPTGADVKYWAPNSTYWFSAMYPQDAAIYTFTTTGTDHTQKITGFSIDPVDTKDIVVSRPSTAVLADKEQQRAAVGLVFDHMLSRVHFSFKNTFLDDNVTIEISNVVLNNVVKTANAVISADAIDDNNYGSITADVTPGVGMAAWTAVGTEKTTLNFCDAADVFTLAKDATTTTKYRLFIPTAAEVKEYKLSFDLVVKADDVTVLTKSYKDETAVGLNLPEGGYKSGNSYLFNANIAGDILENEIYPITFEVKVTKWADDITVDDDIMK